MSTNPGDIAQPDANRVERKEIDCSGPDNQERIVRSVRRTLFHDDDTRNEDILRLQASAIFRPHLQIFDGSFFPGV